MADGEMILYTTEDGVVSIQLRTYEGTVWLSQAEIAELFQMTPQNITVQKNLCKAMHDSFASHVR
jgi:hypothetical protein